MIDPFESLTRIVRAIVGDKRLLTLQVCTVEAQNGMTVDLLPEDPESGRAGLQGVPLKVGLPGFSVVVKLGARVLLGYEAGDERRPYAALFDADSVTSIHFADGTQAIARQGDLIVSGGTGLVVSFAPLVPTPGPMTPGQPYLISFSATPPLPGLAEPLYGSIATGRPEFTS